MTSGFSEEEKAYLKNLNRWNERTSKHQAFFYNICGIVGGVIILYTCLRIIQNVGQENIYLKGLPGFIFAVPFFIIYYFGLKTIDEKNLIASILEKVKKRSSRSK
jgi:hypothetical protein